MDKNRRIFAQGDLDGACFLYAVVNAHAALCKKSPLFADVAQAFAQVDHPQDFLNGTVGTTGHYDRNYALLQDNLERMLALLGAERFHVRRIEGPVSIQALGELVGPGSVAVVRYQGDSELTAEMDHWVCAVAQERASGSVFVACSVRHQKACDGAQCRYEERLHPEYERWSNDVLCAGRGLKIVDGEVFRVTLKS